LASLVEIAFKGNRKEFFHWTGDDPLPLKAAVIVEADRGEDLGRVHATGTLAEQRAAGVPHRPTEEEPVAFSVRRLATDDEVKRSLELREQDEVARRRAMERVKANNLVMKLTDAEWRWDRRKLTIYFTAEKRVDFRNLVRELASMFRTRIELKQIGVRDEAKRLGGIGRCGREYCSSSWLPELRPVNLGVAKDQRLSLNPTQISGACGRLMCCLRYEHDFYVQQRKRFPKEGKLIETSKGEEKVVANDIFRERVTLRAADGEVRVVALAELRREWRNPPAGTQGLDEETSPIPYEAISDEVLRLQDTSELPAWRPGMSAADALRFPRTLPVMPGPAEPAESPRRGERGERGERRERAERGDRRERPADQRRSRDRERGADGTRDAAPEAGRAPRSERDAPEPPPEAPREPRPSPYHGREAPERRGQPPAPSPAPSPARSHSPVAPDEQDEGVPDGADDESPEATRDANPAGDEGERRMRRRRGRRGGRRTRGERGDRGERPDRGERAAGDDAGDSAPSDDRNKPAPGEGA
jgi:cell fate regulator YaaT (PSP1 superfamily)